VRSGQSECVGLSATCSQQVLGNENTCRRVTSTLVPTTLAGANCTHCLLGATECKSLCDYNPRAPSPRWILPGHYCTCHSTTPAHYCTPLPHYCTQVHTLHKAAAHTANTRTPLAFENVAERDWWNERSLACHHCFKTPDRMKCPTNAVTHTMQPMQAFIKSLQ
jgi:hypothetical protein